MMFGSNACLFGPSRGPKVLGYRQGRVYLTGGESYRVGSLAAEWKRQKVGVRAATYLHRPTSAMLTSSAYCGASFEDLPLKGLMGHLFHGIALEKVLSTEALSLDGRGAVRQRSLRRVDGVAIYCDAVVIKKNHCSIDFILTAPIDRYAEIVPAFEQFFGGFHYPGTSNNRSSVRGNVHVPTYRRR